MSDSTNPSATPVAGGTTFKDLCLDVNDPEVMAPFWAGALGLAVEHRGGNVRLVGETDEQAVWLNVVPEPRTVKQRVHIDVHTDAVSRLTGSGATVLDTSQRWTVLADPEGGELCAFVRRPEDLPDYRVYEVVIDCADAPALARWWADVLGLEVDVDGGYGVGPGAGLPWELVFDDVPEPKTVKNRIHWDVWGDVDTLLAAGATLVRARDDEISWTQLADPEGNEFCVFTRD